MSVRPCTSMPAMPAWRDLEAAAFGGAMDCNAVKLRSSIGRLAAIEARRAACWWALLEIERAATMTNRIAATAAPPARIHSRQSRMPSKVGPGHAPFGATRHLRHAFESRHQGSRERWERSTRRESPMLRGTALQCRRTRCTRRCGSRQPSPRPRAVLRQAGP